jgi:hypothetical protein
MLKSFEIRGFRTFQELKIESLGQVNLIVGKNNVGKTTLLEALRLYVTGGSVNELGAILVDRDEARNVGDSSPWSMYRIGSLFYGWTPQPFEHNQIHLGPIDEPAAGIDIRVVPFEVIEGKEPNYLRRYVEIKKGTSLSTIEWTPAIVVKFGGVNSHRVFLSSLDKRWPRSHEYTKRPPLVPATNVAKEQLLRWWDSVRLTSAETRIYEALKFFHPLIIGVDAQSDALDSLHRRFVARIEQRETPVPLKSLGHGVERMFCIALAAEQLHGSNGFASSSQAWNDVEKSPSIQLLLIDEFENGIYYEVLPDLWRFVFRLAKLNNLQVFVTTHSADCVDAFLRVSEEDTEVDGRVIRLEGRDEKRRAKQFGESEFSIIRESKIEVR